jgi:transcriptional regulator with AAA-type ATPase domain
MKKPNLTEALAAIIGPSLDNLKKLVIEFARRDKSALFIGETGTGKELLARLFMAKSERIGQFEAVNCAAFSDDNLLYSELFGHKKGAYTGANVDRPGLIKACENGILFLDEIGHAKKNVLVALLRFLETKDFKPLGSDKSEESDTCIIAAASKEDTLKRELKARFQVIYVPELAFRKRDIYPLIKHYLTQEKIAAITQEALNELEARRYPDNIRGLKNIISKSAIAASLDKSETLKKCHIPPGGSKRPTLINNEERDKPDRIIETKEIDSGENINPIPIEEFSTPFVHPEKKYIEKLISQAQQAKEQRPAQMIDDRLKGIERALEKAQIDMTKMTWDQMVKYYLVKILEKCGGNQVKAAKLAGVNPPTFKKWLKKYKLRPKDTILPK